MSFSTKATEQICTGIVKAIHEKYSEQLTVELDEFLGEFMSDFAEKLPKPDVKKTKAAKDPSKPKRPLNSYMRFARDHRDEVKKEVHADDEFTDVNGRVKNNEVLRRLAALWQEASEAIKDKYLKEYEEEKEKLGASSEDNVDNVANADKPSKPKAGKKSKKITEEPKAETESEATEPESDATDSEPEPEKKPKKKVVKKNKKSEEKH